MKIMKKTLIIFASAIMFMACKSKVSESENNMVLVDTTGLYKNNVLTDVGGKYVINDYALVDKTNIEEGNVDEGINRMGESVVNAKVFKTRSYANTTSSSSRANSNESAAAIPKDKGWSHAAKGTVVGVGTGAITGALLNKEHRGRGALIGAIIGAGSGYIIGRTTDKKTGRVDRARARREANQ